MILPGPAITGLTRSIRMFESLNVAAETKPLEEITLKIETLDTRGLRTPDPILKIAVKSVRMKVGGVLEVWGDCPTFEKDVRTWCEGTGRILLSIESEGPKTKIVRIQF
jgi:tRNA 2-thiouridine synthesizing protein A